MVDMAVEPNSSEPRGESAHDTDAGTFATGLSSLRLLPGTNAHILATRALLRPDDRDTAAVLADALVEQGIVESAYVNALRENPVTRDSPDHSERGRIVATESVSSEGWQLLHAFVPGLRDSTATHIEFEGGVPSYVIFPAVVPLDLPPAYIEIFVRIPITATTRDGIGSEVNLQAIASFLEAAVVIVGDRDFGHIVPVSPPLGSMPFQFTLVNLGVFGIPATDAATLRATIDVVFDVPGMVIHGAMYHEELDNLSILGELATIARRAGSPTLVNVVVEGAGLGSEGFWEDVQNCLNPLTKLYPGSLVGHSADDTEQVVAWARRLHEEDAENMDAYLGSPTSNKLADIARRDAATPKLGLSQLQIYIQVERLFSQSLPVVPTHGSKPRSFPDELLNCFEVAVHPNCTGLLNTLRPFVGILSCDDVLALLARTDSLENTFARFADNGEISGRVLRGVADFFSAIPAEQRDVAFTWVLEEIDRITDEGDHPGLMISSCALVRELRLREHVDMTSEQFLELLSDVRKLVEKSLDQETEAMPQYELHRRATQFIKHLQPNLRISPEQREPLFNVVLQICQNPDIDTVKTTLKRLRQLLSVEQILAEAGDSL